MQFDATINLGTVISLVAVLVTLYGGYRAFSTRVDVILQNQRDFMDRLTERFEAHEIKDDGLFLKTQERLLDLTAGIQRLVGQTDVFRQHGRHHEP